MEDSFSRIPNCVLDALCRAPLTPYESRIVFAIARYSYGFNREYAIVSNGFLAKATGIKRTNVIRVLKALQSKQVVSPQRLGSSNTWKISPEGLVSLERLGLTGETTASLTGETQERNIKKEKELSPSEIGPTGKRGRKKGPPKPPKPPPPPIIEALRLGLGRYPAKHLWPAILEQVNGTPIDTKLLTTHAMEWAVKGYNKSNFLGVIQFHLTKMGVKKEVKNEPDRYAEFYNP